MKGMVKLELKWKTIYVGWWSVMKTSYMYITVAIVKMGSGNISGTVNRFETQQTVARGISVEGLLKGIHK